jgi:hypothetical protein
MAGYSLKLYGSLARSATPPFLGDLTGMAKNWKRSTRAVGGFWQGSFQITGDLPRLQQFFYENMGCHLEEKAGGAISWEGLIYEMELSHAGVRRRRSLDLMANYIQARYLSESATSVLQNGGFEIAGGGGQPFANWTSNDPAWTVDEVNPAFIHAGAHACNAIYHALFPQPHVYQIVPCTGGELCQVTLYTRGDGTNAGQVRLRNVVSGLDLLPITTTGITGTTYTVYAFRVAIPTGCTSVQLYLYAPPTAGACWYDTVSLQFISTTVTATAAVSDLSSIARYGRKDEDVILSGYPLVAAQTRRDTALKERAWPWPRTVSAAPATGPTTLDVMVCGYVFTANWRYLSVQDGYTSNLSAWIGDILTADCPFLQLGAINLNAIQVLRFTSITQRAWDMIKELVDVGGVGGAYWQAFVDVGRRFYYRAIPTTPRYYLRKGGLYNVAGGRQAVTPWLVRPAVVRDMEYPMTRSEPGSFLPDVRDTWIEEVEVDTAGKILLKTSLFSEESMLATQQAREYQ